MSQRTDTPQYRKAYERGWQTNERGADGALDRADFRKEPEAWFDGYYDAGAGRDKWHLLHCPDHDACGEQ
jgi:hypothetical protein